MFKNETGSTLLFMLFFSAVILLTIFGSLPFFMTANQVVSNDIGKLQAKYNAEAGVWLAIAVWKEKQEGFSGRRFELSPGSADVTLIVQNEETLTISSEGKMSPSFRDTLEVKYDPMADKIIEWKRLR